MNKSIHLAKKQDIPALCEIWKQCFSDSDEYIRCFYSRNFERIKVLAYYINETPVSMVHLINTSFDSNAMHQDAVFIYATGTLIEHRGNGYMGKLLGTITEKAKKEGRALFLKPSSPNLLSYYEKFGFVPDSCFNLVLFDSEKAQPIEYRELSAQEYNKMREAAFSEIPHAKWEDAHIQWCIEENELFSGKTLGIKHGGRDYFILAYPEEDTLVINETNLSANMLKELGGSLCSVFDTKRIYAYMPNQTCPEGEKSTANLVYNSLICNPYLNMILI